MSEHNGIVFSETMGGISLPPIGSPTINLFDTSLGAAMITPVPSFDGAVKYGEGGAVTVQFDSVTSPSERDLKMLATSPIKEHFAYVDGRIQPRFVPVKDKIKPAIGRVDYGWDDEMKRKHLKSAYARGWNQFPYTNRRHNGVIHIVGGGPSLKCCLPALRKAARKKRNFVLSLNKTHDFLWNLPKLGLGQAIPSWGAALLDPCDWVKDYITPRPGVQYFIGDQCAPATFDVFDKPELNKWIWRATNPNKDRDLVPDSMVYIYGGSTVGLRCRKLAYMFGFREIHYWGFDSSAEITPERPDGKMHGYAKDESVKDRMTIKPVLEDGTVLGEFLTNSHMARQADEFVDLRRMWIKAYEAHQADYINEVFHGDGLLPTIAASMGLHADAKRNIPGSTAITRESQNQGASHAA